jgi:hypothetical protein
MTDWKDKAFDFASDVTKQLITLATAVVTVTVTFSKDVLSIAAGSGRGILGAMWIAFLVSILFGLATLLAMAGQLGRTSEPDIYAGGVRIFSMAQIVAFLAGDGIAVWFVIYALGKDVVVPPPA